MVKQTRQVMAKTTDGISRLSRAGYAGVLLLFGAVYGGFLYYTTKYLDVIMDGITHLRLNEEVKVAAVLTAAYLVMWGGLLAASVCRGRDIGFGKWASVMLYLVPAMPRFLGMLFAVDIFAPWVDILSNILWVVVSATFLLLPQDWYYYQRRNKTAG